jgi:hypothetical protein
MMGNYFDALPKNVQSLIRTHTIAEYATISQAGIPIDTPAYYFPAADLTTIDIGTGISYPAKADRARRNPKVGLLIEGDADEPVISIAGMAAVRDADLQANLNRYIEETILSPTVHPDLVPWEKTRERLYYLTRIIVCVAPMSVRWWPNRAASMEDEPTYWHADPDTTFPESDPAPPGKPTPGPKWKQRTWQDMADIALGQGAPAHLTLIDDGGFPLPFRVKTYRRHEDGFAVTVPKSVPWREGKATLSFVGKEIFVGDARIEGNETILQVERALPNLPTVDDQGGRKEEVPLLFERLQAEIERRKQTLPVAPETPPEPTEGCVLRAPAYGTLDASAPGGRKEKA